MKEKMKFFPSWNGNTVIININYVNALINID